MLDRSSADLLIICVSFLKKLCIFEENKDVRAYIFGARSRLCFLIVYFHQASLTSNGRYCFSGVQGETAGLQVGEVHPLLLTGRWGGEVAWGKWRLASWLLRLCLSIYLSVCQSKLFVYCIFCHVHAGFGADNPTSSLQLVFWCGATILSNAVRDISFTAGNGIILLVMWSI